MAEKAKSSEGSEGSENSEYSPVCECGKSHENDYYPEQCPTCEKWFVGQCASDNLIYTEDDDSVPCSCLECEKAEESDHEEEKKAEENASNIK